jgi:hypothetical protein
MQFYVARMQEQNVICNCNCFRLDEDGDGLECRLPPDFGRWPGNTASPEPVYGHHHLCGGNLVPMSQSRALLLVTVFQ